MSDKHYVNNEKFLEEMVVFRTAVLESKEKGLERPMVPNYIGD
jgi:hypothetical protein